MAILRESEGFHTQRQALRDALNRISLRAQPKFTNPLRIRYYEPDTDYPYDCPLSYITEVRTKRWLRIFTRKEYRKIFAIDPRFFGAALGKKEIDCAVFDSSILDIVMEVIQKYADAFRSTAIYLTQDFVA